MSHIGTPLVGLFDLCFAAPCLLIALLVSYVAPDFATYLKPATGGIPWLSFQLMRPNLDSEHPQASSLPSHRAGVINNSWPARLRRAIQAR
jgi:hypothetical protein